MNNCYNQEYSKWLKDFDFKYMLTIKHHNPMNAYKCLDQVSLILNNYNKKVFGRSFINDNTGVSGFVCFEPDKWRTPNVFHNHVLVIRQPELERFNIYQQIDILVKSSERLIDSQNKRNFIHSHRDVIWKKGVSGIETGCFHIVEVYSDKASDYVVKKINEECTSVKHFGTAGISDKDLTFVRRKYGYKTNCYH